MFKKNVYIKGKHAVYMKQLTAVIDTATNYRLFERNLDVYIMAPIIGLVYGRAVESDNEIKDDTSIHTEQLQGEIDTLTYNYRLVMLGLNKMNCRLTTGWSELFGVIKMKKREKPGDELFLRFVLGGIEVLYEKIMAESKEIDDLLRNLFMFLNEYNERYNSVIDDSAIYDLCKLASE